MVGSVLVWNMFVCEFLGLVRGKKKRVLGIFFELGWMDVVCCFYKVYKLVGRLLLYIMCVRYRDVSIEGRLGYFRGLLIWKGEVIR